MPHQRRLKGTNLRAWTQQILINVVRSNGRRHQHKCKALQALSNDPCSWTTAASNECSSELETGLCPLTQRAIDGVPQPFRATLLHIDVRGLREPDSLLEVQTCVGHDSVAASRGSNCPHADRTGQVRATRFPLCEIVFAIQSRLLRFGDSRCTALSADMRPVAVALLCEERRLAPCRKHVKKQGEMTKQPRLKNRVDTIHQSVRGFRSSFNPFAWSHAAGDWRPERPTRSNLI